MSAFTNFLSGTTYPNGTSPMLRDFQHATRLYVDSNYARAPKFGFLYFIQINFNSGAVLDQQWLSQRGSKDVGLLAKSCDLPNFTIATETANQYNRKTVVQTKLTYSPVAITLHDDNSNLTHNLWVNYFKHYYADSNHGDSGKIGKGSTPEGFRDTKYGTVDYTYGRHNNNRSNTPDFLSSIDIYVLNQQRFTQYTLVNPKITEWKHDSVDADSGNKVLANRMTVQYETVLYNSGTIQKGTNPEEWIPIYYDNNPSPNGVPKNPFPDPRAVVYRSPGALSNPIKDIATILLKNYVNKNGVGRVKGVGYNVASGVLGALGSGSPGKYAAPPDTQNQPGILNLPGGVGINIFKGINTTVDGKIRANPAAIIFPKR